MSLELFACCAVAGALAGWVAVAAFYGLFHSLFGFQGERGEPGPPGMPGPAGLRGETGDCCRCSCKPAEDAGNRTTGTLTE